MIKHRVGCRRIIIVGLLGLVPILAACTADESGVRLEAVSSTTLSPATTAITATTATTTTAATVVVTAATTATSGGVDSTATTAPTEAMTTAPTEATTTAPGDSGCGVGSVPQGAGLDPFYRQGCTVDGFWVVASDVVDPEALTRAGATVAAFFVADPDLASTIALDSIRLGVMGADQRTTEMPEYRDLYQVFPGTDWDNRSRGLGATAERPLVSVGEENLLCRADDPYRGEDLLVHEFAHVLHEFGYRNREPGFDTQLAEAYRQAMENGTWADTYAATNAAEYWAEGVQSYFGRNLTADPADGIHGPIDTKEELRAADPALFNLIDSHLAGVDLPRNCS